MSAAAETFDSHAVAAIGIEIRAARAAGVTTVAVAHELTRLDSPDPRVVADALCHRTGFRGLATGWRVLPRVEAELLVGHVLAKDLAYNHACMETPCAYDLAHRFVATFPAGATFVTNVSAGKTTSESLNSWDPVSESTFDVVVVVVCGDSGALLCVQDED